MRVALFLLLFLYIPFNSQGQWLPVGGGFSITPGNPSGYDPEVSDLSVFDGELYAVGIFDSAGGGYAKNIAKWDGNSWSNLPIYGSPRDMQNFEGDLYLVGPTGNLGAVQGDFISKWDGVSWMALDSNKITSSFQEDGPHILDTFQNELWIAGKTFKINSTGQGYTMLKWNGFNYSPPPNLSLIKGSVRGFGHNETDLIITGIFDSVNHLVGKGILKFDGSQYYPYENYPFIYCTGAFTLGTRFFACNGWYVENDSFFNFSYGTTFKNPVERQQLMYSSLTYIVQITDQNLNFQFLGDSLQDSNDRINSLCFYKDTLYAAGIISSINGTTYNGIMKWTGPLPSGSLNGFDPDPGYTVFHLNIFPNPASVHLTMEINSKANQPVEGSILLSDVNGREVLSQHLKTSKETLDLSNLPSGIYFARIEANGVVEYRKVVKE